MRAAFEPIENLVLYVGRDARTGISHGEHDAAIGSAGADADGSILRREADRVGKKIIQHLHYAPFVADEAASIGFDFDLEPNPVRGEPVLDSFGGGFDGFADVDRAEFESHCACIDGSQI